MTDEPIPLGKWEFQKKSNDNLDMTKTFTKQ